MLRRNGVWYWVVTAAMLAFGVLSILSVGWLFLTAGIVMAVAGVTGWATSRPKIFWPVVAGIGAFFVGYLAVAPWSCHASPTSGNDVVAVAECASLLGFTYEGGGGSNPSLWPGVAAGLVVAAATAAATRMIIMRR